MTKKADFKDTTRWAYKFKSDKKWTRRTSDHKNAGLIGRDDIDNVIGVDFDFDSIEDYYNFHSLVHHLEPGDTASVYDYFFVKRLK